MSGPKDLPRKGKGEVEGSEKTKEKDLSCTVTGDGGADSWPS